MRELSVLPSYRRCEVYTKRHDAHNVVMAVVKVLVREGMASPHACAWLADWRLDSVFYRLLSKLLALYKVKFESMWQMCNKVLHAWHQTNVPPPPAGSSSASETQGTGSRKAGANGSAAGSRPPGPADSSIGASQQSPSLRLARAAPYTRACIARILEETPADIVTVVQSDLAATGQAEQATTLEAYRFTSPSKKTKGLWARRLSTDKKGKTKCQVSPPIELD